MARVVVTGGAGFLGSHLCETLLARGDVVVAVDNFITGNADNVRSFRDHPNFSLVVADVSEHLPVEGPVDAVMHFASPASPPAYFAHPFATLAVGSNGTRNALELARRDGARFLLASTSEIYGDPLVHPQREDYWGNVNPIGPRSVYDEAKRFAEAITMAYHREYGLDAKIVRIFNTYGPRLGANDGRVISNFLNQAIDGKPLTVYGAGEQTRSFCFVDDEVRGILALLDSAWIGPMNIGNPSEFTIMELVAAVQRCVDDQLEVVYEPMPIDDPTQRRPDISVARDQLGWEPVVDLASGLARTLDWYRSQR